MDIFTTITFQEALTANKRIYLNTERLEELSIYEIEELTATKENWLIA